MDGIIEDTKICSTCGKTLPIVNFYYRTDTNKYRGQCIQCNKGYLHNKQLYRKEVEKLLERGLKRCGTCDKVLPLDNFNSDKYTITKFTSSCKSCINLKVKKYYNSEQGKKTMYLKRYDITEEEYILFKNATSCEICGKIFVKNNQNLGSDFKHLDHNHITNKFRGVLCASCNKGIGHFYDNPDFLKNAFIYLQQRQ